MHTTWDSPLGELTLVRSGDALSGVYFPRHWTRPDPSRFGPRTDSGFDAVIEQLDEYFAGRRRSFELASAADGTEFEHRVWARIGEIRYGETRTYAELAEELGNVRGAREVGAAVGSNPLSIVVPCHRVVGKDGALTGYAGGLRRKRFLLDLEQDQHARLF